MLLEWFTDQQRGERSAQLLLQQAMPNSKVTVQLLCCNNTTPVCSDAADRCLTLFLHFLSNTWHMSAASPVSGKLLHDCWCK
jgi:hypothetical protein